MAESMPRLHIRAPDPACDGLGTGRESPKTCLCEILASQYARSKPPCSLPVDWLQKLELDTLPSGLKAKDYDYIHCAIYVDEMSRAGISGPATSLTAGMRYGVPPIIKYGSKALREQFLPELLTGKKRACIAITEPTAGSDVANISTTAERSGDGKFYIINGQKKWFVS